jgi:tripartite ATP-independent transporter DctM subunit
MEWIAVILFVLVFVLTLVGYPIALVLGGISTLFGILFVPDFLDLLPLRIMGVMQNYVLISVPLFIFMGLTLEKSGLAESLLSTMSTLFGNMKGGLAVSVIIVGTLLAASTGIVGATVITMGLISLPSMLKMGYSVPLSTGTIAASGTLGQIIPPSIVLILLGSVLNVSVGDLFAAALLPGIVLVVLYIIYVLIRSNIGKEKKNITISEDVGKRPKLKNILIVFLMPLFLIVLVLGSIFMGIASPTEAAAVGAMGAIFISILAKKLNLKVVKEICVQSSQLTSMVFLILLGATTFALVFRGLGGEKLLIDLVQNSELSANQFILLLMLIIFIAGFFIDFIEIIFIIVPVVLPILVMYKVNLLWIGILMALNLQTSFLTPPFGFALFYLKGVAPAHVKTIDIYKGVIPYLAIQIIVLLLVFLFPDFWIG